MQDRIRHADMHDRNDRTQYTPGHVQQAAETRGRICNASRVLAYVTSNRVGDTFW